MALHQIILIGRRMDSALLGVKEFHPAALHLLYTVATKDVYKPFAAHMASEGISVQEYLIDPYEPMEIAELCKSIKASLDPGDTLMYNITEGTKIAAAAIVINSEGSGDCVAYFTQEGEVVDFSVPSRRPTASRIRNEEFFDIFVDCNYTYNDVADMPRLDVATSLAVKSFVENYQKTFQRIQRQFRSQFGAHLDKLPEFFAVEREHNMTIRITDGGMKIVDRGRTIFEDANPMATRLFFTGRWWETLVSDTVWRWDRKRHANPDDSQVWRNVEFRSKGSGRSKNELDVLVNDRRRLLFIECKSGYISQDNVYKVDSVRDTYGGENSKSILVSYYPLDEDLATKCRDLHIYLYAPSTNQERISHLNMLPEWLDGVVKEIE